MRIYESETWLLHSRPSVRIYDMMFRMFIGTVFKSIMNRSVLYKRIL